MRPAQVLSSLLAVSICSNAWPWPPPSLEEIKTLAQENGLYQRRSTEFVSLDGLERRQDNGGGGEGGNGNNNGGGQNNNAPPPSSSNNPPPSSSGSAPSSSDSNAPPSSGSSSASSSNTGSNTDSNTSGSSSATDSDSNSKPDSKTTAPPSSQYTGSIPADAQPGGINMITPNTQSTATQYYKVSQTITWVWNYTSLLRAPQNIDIVATVSGTSSGANPSPFTLASNYSFAPTETFTWDTGAFANETNLPQGMYTLLVYDAAAQGGASATASAGYLGLYNQFHFGMYNKKDPTALATPYQCATCNAGSQLERWTLWSLLAVAGVTVGSFMWFVETFGALQ